MDTTRSMPNGGCRKARQRPRSFKEADDDLITNDRQITTGRCPRTRSRSWLGFDAMKAVLPKWLARIVGGEDSRWPQRVAMQ
jgi:hypothetical protein